MNIKEILAGIPNWHELVLAKYGYLKVNLGEPSHVYFVSASKLEWEDPDDDTFWENVFLYGNEEFNEEIWDAIERIEVGKEILVVVDEDAPNNKEVDWYRYFEVIPLPVPIPRILRLVKG